MTTKTKTKRKPIPQVAEESLRLNCDAIDSQPIDVDWQATLGENCDGWTSYEAHECEKCGALVVLTAGSGGGPHEDYDNDTKCDGYVSTAEGPMMNAFYPVHLTDMDDAAKALKNLPLCVVQFEDGRTGLALTGGGMDLSWEIAEGFIRLGYFPPIHFADLPAMAFGDGPEASKTRDLTVRAMREALMIKRRWIDRDLAHLAGLKTR